MAGVSCMESVSGTFLVASPLKALADMVASRGLDWTDSKPLVLSLRIEPDDLGTLSSHDFDILDGVYYSRRARVFLQNLRKELKL